MMERLVFWRWRVAQWARAVAIRPSRLTECRATIERLRAENEALKTGLAETQAALMVVKPKADQAGKMTSATLKLSQDYLEACETVKHWMQLAMSQEMVAKSAQLTLSRLTEERNRLRDRVTALEDHMRTCVPHRNEVEAHLLTATSLRWATGPHTDGG